MLPGPPRHLQAVLDGVVLPRILAHRRTQLETREIAHPYPEIIIAGELARIRRRHPLAKAGSYPGESMIIRFTGPVDEVDRATEEFERYLVELNGDPRTESIREGWRVGQATGWKTKA